MDKICSTINLFHAFTCFEHHVLIVRRSKLYYTASGIITPLGGRNMHLSTGRSTNHQKKKMTSSFKRADCSNDLT